MNSINSRISFILLLIFTIGLFFSAARLITHNNFPVIDQKHNNYYNHHSRLKEIINIQKKNINSEDVCENITNKIIDRHHLRWVFEELRINFIDSFSDLLAKKSGLSIGFSIMLSFLIISTFFISLLTVQNNLYEYIKNHKTRYIILLLVFFSIISFYSFRFVSELRYSFFEMFFLSISLFSSIKKQKFLFLVITILATLNRESGILISSIWFIINGLQINNKKINFSIKDGVYGLFFVIISVLTLILANYQIFSCGLTLEFLSYKDPNTLPVFNENIIRSVNIIFSNFLVIILLLYFFYFDFEKQLKLILIILFYNIVFLFFTPADHTILRIMFAPIILIYVHQFLEKSQESSIIK